jgi:hypothetical protein
MKVRKKTDLIDAERYERGMEDGFVIRYRDKKDPNSTWGIGGEGEEEVEIPYIEGAAGRKQLISCGDWVLTHKNRSRSVISNKKFVKMYESVVVYQIEGVQR